MENSNINTNLSTDNENNNNNEVKDEDKEEQKLLNGNNILNEKKEENEQDKINEKNEVNNNNKNDKDEHKKEEEEEKNNNKNENKKEEDNNNNNNNNIDNNNIDKNDKEEHKDDNNNNNSNHNENEEEKKVKEEEEKKEGSNIKEDNKDEIKKDKDKNKDKEEEPQQNEMQYSHTLEETMEKYLIQKMPDNSKEDANFKILFLGDSGVGKSSLVIRGIKKEFDSCYKPTVGFDLINYVVKINDKIIKLQIWDTCGQEEFSMCNQSLYKNATMAVMVYSIISKKSYNNIKKWVNHAKDLSNENIIFFLVGNKCDLYNEREVSFNDAKRYSKDFKFFVETSSKFGNNVDNLFKKIVIYLYENIVKTEFDENNDSKNEEFITEGSSSFLDSHILQIEGKKKCLKCC